MHARASGIAASTSSRAAHSRTTAPSPTLREHSAAWTAILRQHDGHCRASPEHLATGYASCISAAVAASCSGIVWCARRNGGACVPKCISAHKLPPFEFHAQLRAALLSRSAIWDRPEADKVSLAFYSTNASKPRPVEKQGKAVQSYHALAHSLLFHLRGDATGKASESAWLEFGVAGGFSLNATCHAIRQRALPGRWRVHGFDTFVGLPEPFTTPSGVVMSAGHFSQGGNLPPVAQPCGVLHKGLLNTTLPSVVRTMRRSSTYVAGLSIDVDLYAGSQQVLELAFPLLREGAILHFHELGRGLCCMGGCSASRCWPTETVQEEARALQEYLQRRPSVLLGLLPITGPPGQPEQAAAFTLVRSGVER